MTEESYVLVFCGTPLSFYEELEILLVNHLDVSFIYHSEKLASLGSVDLVSSDNQKEGSSDHTHFIYLGPEKAVALEKARLNYTGDNRDLDSQFKKITFIPFSDQWLETIDGKKVNWNTVELESDDLMPIEELLNTFGHDARNRLENIEGAFMPLLDYAHHNTRVSKESKSLATLLENDNELHLRTLDNLTFAVLPASDQPYFLHALLVLRHRRKNEDYHYQDYAPTPVIAFFYQGESFPTVNNIENINDLSLDSFGFYGDKEDFDKVSPIFNAAGDAFIDNGKDDGYLSRVVYDCSDKVLDHSFNQTISDACLALMGENRILEHYSCTFFLPLYMGQYPYNNQLVKGIDSVKYDATSEQGKALQHFYPSVRDYIFDTGKNASHDAVQPIREWTLRDITDIDQFIYQWCVTQPDVDKVIEADITDVRLYQYFNQVCLLAISVQSTGVMDDHLELDDACWWYNLVFSSQQRWQFLKSQQMSDWLSFTRSARVLFPRFSQGQDKHAASSENYLVKSCMIHEKTRTKTKTHEGNGQSFEKNNFSNLLSYFLHCFFTVDDVNRYFANSDQQVLEELLFVNATYGYYGAELDQENGDRLLGQALSMEPEGNCLNTSTCHQIRTKNMLSGYSKDSNVYLGCGSSFNNITAKEMIPSVYGRTLLMSLFYQASLCFYDRKIVSLTENIKVESTSSDYKKTQELMSGLQKTLTYFSNIFWIDDVTPEAQGKEVFKLQQQVLGLTHKCDLIKGKMSRVDELLRGEYQLLMYKKSSKANFFLVLLMAIIAIIIGVDLLGSGFFSEWGAKFWKLIGR